MTTQVLKGELLQKETRAAVAAGSPSRAYAAACRLIKLDASNVSAWLIRAATTGDPAEKIESLEWVLIIDPSRMDVRRQLLQLTGVNPLTQIVGDAVVQSRPSAADTNQPPTFTLEALAEQLAHAPAPGLELDSDPDQVMRPRAARSEGLTAIAAHEATGPMPDVAVLPLQTEDEPSPPAQTAPAAATNLTPSAVDTLTPAERMMQLLGTPLPPTADSPTGAALSKPAAQPTSLPDGAEEALEASPEQHSAREAAQALVDEGAAALSSRHVEDAYILFRQATMLDPHMEMAWLMRSRVARDPAEIQDCLNRVLELNPANVEARRELRLVRLQLMRENPQGVAPSSVTGSARSGEDKPAPAPSETGASQGRGGGIFTRSLQGLRRKKDQQR
ncbi:MAG: hypothetical protein HY259_04540 [Chloroflexi bacterium]|nr:hypothetical protein [Chloroflexota bacterium]